MTAAQWSKLMELEPAAFYRYVMAGVLSGKITKQTMAHLLAKYATQRVVDKSSNDLTS